MGELSGCYIIYIYIYIYTYRYINILCIMIWSRNARDPLRWGPWRDRQLLFHTKMIMFLKPLKPFSIYQLTLSNPCGICVYVHLHLLIYLISNMGLSMSCRSRAPAPIRHMRKPHRGNKRAVWQERKRQQKKEEDNSRNTWKSVRRLPKQATLIVRGNFGDTLYRAIQFPPFLPVDTTTVTVGKGPVWIIELCVCLG